MESNPARAAAPHDPDALTITLAVTHKIRPGDIGDNWVNIRLRSTKNLGIVHEPRHELSWVATGLYLLDPTREQVYIKFQLSSRVFGSCIFTLEDNKGPSSNQVLVYTSRPPLNPKVGDLLGKLIFKRYAQTRIKVEQL